MFENISDKTRMILRFVVIQSIIVFLIIALVFFLNKKFLIALLVAILGPLFSGIATLAICGIENGIKKPNKILNGEKSEDMKVESSQVKTLDEFVDETEKKDS